MRPDAALRTGSIVLLLLALGLVAYAVVFVAWVFVGGTLELGIDASSVGVMREEIRAFDPSLLAYLDHLHVAVGGFMLGLGVAAGGLAWFGVRRGHRWSLWVLLVALGGSVVVAVPLHYVHGFTSLLHLGPLYLGAVLAILGASLSWTGLQARAGEGKA